MAPPDLADSFDPNANGNVQSIAVQADGKILAGGMFSSIGGQTRSLFARLTNDTAALQNLAVTQTTITWTLGGSSLQFTRVIFEYSADNVTYTSLGNGTATGNNWILTGLNLPTGQNIYIRARGYYRCGFSNGSESTMESVRNAFLSGGRRQRRDLHHRQGRARLRHRAHSHSDAERHINANWNGDGHNYTKTFADGEATSHARAAAIGQHILTAVIRASEKIIASLAPK